MAVNHIPKKGNNTVYVYYLTEDGEKMPEQIKMSSYSLPAKARIKMLGTDTFLKLAKTDKGFTIINPDKIRKASPL